MLRVKAIRVIQPYGDFYLSSIKARDLLSVIYVKRFQAVIDDDQQGFYRMEGLQRRYSESRKRLIAKFVRSEEATFPGTVILSANTPILTNEDLSEEVSNDENEHEEFWTIETSENDIWINIPEGKKLASVIDGQHRLYGFLEALAEMEKDQKLIYDPAIERALDIELPCSIFFDLNPEHQAYIFATINFNQKSVDKSLAYELFNVSLSEELDTWSPDKLAIYITRRLNSVKDETINRYNATSHLTFNDSPLQGRIKIANQEDISHYSSSKKDWMISTATVVTGILKLFSKNSQKDRYIMYDEYNRGVRSVLKDDNTPMRLEYIYVRDEYIYYAVSHYFSVIDQYLWKRIGSDSFYTKTVGIIALFSLLERLMFEDYPRMRDISMEYFERKLTPLKKIRSDNINEAGQASGIGKTQLTNILMFAMGYIEYESGFRGKLPPGYDTHLDYYRQFIE